MLLEDSEKSPLYIFYDDNQNIYSRLSSFPITDEPYYLTLNCRNTDQIHNAAYKYYMGEDVLPPGIEGDKINVITEIRPNKQADKIHSLIHQLLKIEKVNASDITVLITDGRTKKNCYKLLSEKPLPKPNKWQEEGIKYENHILVDTVKRFKGLESAIVILWSVEGINEEDNSNILYVGISRAKSMVYIISPNHFNLM